MDGSGDERGKDLRIVLLAVWIGEDGVLISADIPLCWLVGSGGVCRFSGPVSRMSVWQRMRVHTVCHGHHSY